MSKLYWLRPVVSRRILLFIAAGVWTFAGSMLFYKGFKMLDLSSRFVGFKLILVLTAGIVFYHRLFSRLSMKHTLRILQMKEARPWVFSFFNLRSYLMMVLMISMGVTLRKSGLIAPEYLSMLYLTMAIPLMLSSIRFYYTGLYYRNFVVAAVRADFHSSAQVPED